MSARTVRRLAILNCFLVPVLVAAGLALDALSLSQGKFSANLATDVVLVPVVFILTAMGALIVSRRPGNRIGIGMCMIGTVAGMVYVTDAYATYGLVVSPGSLPAARMAGWVENWIWIPVTVPVLTLLFLYCPDGELVSKRWRPVAALDVVVMILLWLTFAFRPGPFEDFPDVSNPLGIGNEGGVVDTLAKVGITLLLPAIVLSAASMVVRFRRSTGLERMQLKWLASAAALAGFVFVGSFILRLSGVSVWNYAIPVAFMPTPIALGIAILQYRLYDIDRIINRTLVYGLLTATLGLTYFGLVVGLQALFQPVTGGSDVAIAFTTLVVAALFLPARRRIQDAVDSRFNRRRYDAARTLAAFSARLRDEVDMETLQGDLIAVVNETVQPAHVSLWLRAPEARR
jgi:hypothetical protein